MRRDVSKHNLSSKHRDIEETGVAYGGSGLSDAPLHAIHRGPDGTIPLARKLDGMKWETLGSLRVGQPLLPELFGWLTKDSYFGLNSGYGKPAPRQTGTRTQSRWESIPGMPQGEQRIERQTPIWSHTHPETGLPLVAHTNDTLRWLNVAFADLDCYNLGLSVADTIGALIELQDEGRIPPASVIVRSGRGVWVLWLLIDTMNPETGTKDVYGVTHTPDTPQRACSWAMREYAAVQGAIVRSLAHLGADEQVPATRHAPMPGSEKTRAGERVRYWVQQTDSGIPRYTLPALSKAFGADVPAATVTKDRKAREPFDVTPEHRERGIRGHKARWRNTAIRLETLFAYRRGYGNCESRHLAALWHAAALWRSGESEAAVRARVREFWELSRTAKRGDVLKDADLADTFKQAMKPHGRFHNLNTKKYLWSLRVTPKELDLMESAVAGKAGVGTAAPPNTRQLAICDSIKHGFGGRVPSIRQMQAHLRRLGISASVRTVLLDYGRLGIKAAHRAGRPPKLPF